MEKTIEILKNRLRGAYKILYNVIWQKPIDQLSPFKAFLVRQARVIFLALQSALGNKIYLLAPALTFYSVLSIVPAAALAIGIAKGFGLERFLEQQLRIALAGREEVLNWVMDLTDTFFSQIDGLVIALTGLGILIYTVLMLMTMVEKMFNQIWQVPYGRSLLHRLRDYFAIILLGPLLFIAAGALTVFISARIQILEDSLLDPLLIFTFRATPYLLIWLLFTLLYIIMPNTRVHFYPALINGIIAGTIFQLLQWVYLTFQIGAASLGVIYGSFAALPLLLIWMQISWAVVLFGAELTHAAQNMDRYSFGLLPEKISPYNRKIISLYILHWLLKGYEDSPTPVSAHQVSTQLKMPELLVEEILESLCRVNLLSTAPPATAVNGGPEVLIYQPAADASTISITGVLKLLELEGSSTYLPEPSPVLEELISSVEELGKAIEESEANRLLVDL